MEPITRKYLLRSNKLKDTLSVVLIGDLHSRVYEPDNAPVLDAVRKARPDLILCPGDMIIGRREASYDTALSFLQRLSGIAPVYFSNGNHETHASMFGEALYTFLCEVQNAGVCVLNNEAASCRVRGTPIQIFGLEIPYEKYRKFRIPHLTEREIIRRIGTPDKDSYHILIAHNPQFVPQYLDWGADLAVCGHFHGGMIRLPDGRSLLSPYGFLLPRFGYGKFVRKNGQAAVVTSGLGDHAIPFRVHDPEEIVHIVITGTRGEKHGD